MTGKKVSGDTYIHTSAVEVLQPDERRAFEEALGYVRAASEPLFNVVKFEQGGRSVSLLHYPSFFEDACPPLAQGWHVNLSTGRVSFRTYKRSANPPILHRKELMLKSDDPRRARSALLTSQLEAIGAFDQPLHIGFQKSWEHRLSHLGYCLGANELLPLGNETGPMRGEIERLSLDGEVHRHRTALTRYALSAPVQLLYRVGLLSEDMSFFDYGCGKGSDIRLLRELGIEASGWDPHFAAGNQRIPAEVVNLGFVLNVIEDPAERNFALEQAFALARKVLVVAVMPTSNLNERAQPYRDGFMTGRQTFQKYYSQPELRSYVESILGRETVAAVPGIVLVFKEHEDQVRYELSRLSRRSTFYLPRLPRPERPQAPNRPRAPRATPTDRLLATYEASQQLLDNAWSECLSWGRIPDASESPTVAQALMIVGSANRLAQVLLARHGQEQLEEAERLRRSDILVYLALRQFQRRSRLKDFEGRIQRDIRAFFGSLGNASDEASALLRQIANPARMYEAVEQAAAASLGHLDDDEHLTLHSSRVPLLAPVLRVYVGAGAALAGDVAEMDLVKIHLRSGKVSFMKYDRFMEMPLPKMRQRLKVNLRAQTEQLFEYGEEYPEPYLYLKSRFMDQELDGYDRQVVFDKQLAALGLDLSGYGPSVQAFGKELEDRCLEIQGFALVRSTKPPQLDDLCGRYLTYRSLIECGETISTSRLINVPKVIETYAALRDLAVNVLDPVIEYFGMIELTFGFCSPELSQKLKGRVNPSRDQHCSHEVSSRGRRLCERDGAAVDFLVRDTDMTEVANWICSNLRFDQIYFYGPNRPVHVSYRPEASAACFSINELHNGRRVLTPTLDFSNGPSMAGN